MNQFEYMHRAHKAIAIFAFSRDLIVSRIEIGPENITVESFRGEYGNSRTDEFASLEVLEKAAYGF